MAKSNAQLAAWRRHFHYDLDLEPERRELSTLEDILDQVGAALGYLQALEKPTTAEKNEALAIAGIAVDYVERVYEHLSWSEGSPMPRPTNLGVAKKVLENLLADAHEKRAVRWMAAKGDDDDAQEGEQEDGTSRPAPTSKRHPKRGEIPDDYEVNIRIKKYLDSHPRATIREVAGEVGLSTGKVAQLDAWRRAVPEREAAKLPPKKSGRPLTDKMLAAKRQKDDPAAKVMRDEAIWPTAGYTVLDVDPKNGGDKTLAELQKKHGALPVTPTAKIGGGGRHYWFLGSAKSKANKATGLDVRSEGGYVVAPPSLHQSGSHYQWLHDLRTPMVPPPAWLTEALLATKEKAVAASPTAAPLTLTWGDSATDLATHPGADEGERNATLCRLVGVHIDQGDSKPSVLAMAKVWNKRCRPPDEDNAVEKAVASLYAKAEAKGEYPAHGQNGHVSFVRHPVPPQPSTVLSDVDDTPTVAILDAAAYHGVLGEYVRLMEPQTEADPAAILVASVVAFGNACGHEPFFGVKADRHHANLFAVCVGESGHGRKGVSLGRALALLPDPYRQNNIAQGLSLGEALIAAVRDETTKFNAKAGVFEILDPGVSDKRLLVTETEFAQTLKVLKRECNTLSPLLRQAFDGGVLRAMTKTQTKATEPHVSIIAHVTRPELSKSLGQSEYFNGFANRFLWALTRRSKLLPDGGEGVDISPLRERVAEALGKAKAFTAMKRSPQAKALWWELYADLNKDRPGLFGACTSRAAPSPCA